MSNLIAFVNDQQPLFKQANKVECVTWEQESQFAIQALQSNDFLAKAAENNLARLQNAIINVAAVGISLNPALKHAYLVPRSPAKGQPAQVFLDISYQGLLHIAMTSGAIEWGQAKLVYEKDSYENVGIDKPPVHKQNTFGDKGKVIGVYCTVKTPSGDYLTEEMDLEAIQKVANTSKAANGPWRSWWEEMARKTVVKRASKYWPRADRVSSAANILNEHEGLAPERQEKDITPQQETITDEQAEALRIECQRIGWSDKDLCAAARVSEVEDIQQCRFDAAMNHLRGQPDACN